MNNWSNWRKANYEFFKTHLSGEPKTSVLFDLGCGKCQFASLFKEFLYIGVDSDDYGQEMEMDLDKPFRISDNIADIITASNTIEHIPDTKLFLKECYRILKPGGMMVATIPFLLGEHQIPRDFNRYTHFQLRRLFEDAGFFVPFVTPLGKLVDVYNSIELKVFDELPDSLTKTVVRSLRRAEMRVIRWLFRSGATNRITEGYGVLARKPWK